MKVYWWCLTCGKDGRVGTGNKHLNRNIRIHAENNHPGEIVEYLTIDEYGKERKIIYEKRKIDG